MTTSQPAPQPITLLLQRWRGGDDAAMEELIPLVYKEIYKRARFYISKERRNHTISCTELVNEVYLKLVGERDRIWHNRIHFFAVAARIMRHYLIRYAEARETQKRGGDRIVFTMANLDELGSTTAEHLLPLNEALGRLEKRDVKKVRILEMRFFMGMKIQEIADVMEISPATVKRELQFAKAWLSRHLRKP